MEPNAPLLRKTMEQIREHPEHWMQSTYRILINPDILRIYGQDNEQLTCGTAMCFAGWACEIADVKWLDVDGYDLYADDGTITTAAEKARDLLGLDGIQAGRLFQASNSLDELEYLVESFIEGTFDSDEWGRMRMARFEREERELRLEAEDVTPFSLSPGT